MGWLLVVLGGIALSGSLVGMYRASQAKDWGWFWASLFVGPAGWIYLLGPGKRRSTELVRNSHWVSLWVFLAAVLTGFFTGLFVASAEEFLSRDGELDGIEALATFIPLPMLAALLVAKGFSLGLRRHRLAPKMTGRTLSPIAKGMAGVAYLTLLIPLFGIGMGGANVLQQMLGGAIGGAFWGLIFAVPLFRKSPISE